ncbi:MAG TPA: 4-hydroxybenzoate octaprenyltransferase, partial [Alphaproteobacteria bacterium]|nr:4-hydroxybenzoate octaprenyltransferase [Alphaproteobacteria bacterium]
DALIGVKSTALKFGAHVRGAVAAFYCAALVLFAAAAWSAEVGAWFWAAFAPAAAHLGWQARALEIDNPDRCLAVFRANREFGLLMFLAIIVGKVW